MTPTNPSTCPQDHSLEFLAGELTAADQATWEQHLEHCEACRQQLEQLTASDIEWQQAEEFLSDDELDGNHDSSCLTSPDDQRAGRLAVRQALDLLAPTDDPQMLGRIGSYEVQGVIGAGGMGVVFKALDRSLNRYVAIKVLAPHLATVGSARRRFARESQAAAAVVHDNVVEIYGVSEDHDPPYLVMPLIRGASLQKRLADQGPLQLTEILRIAQQTASGLAAAHAQGLIHRDIKPANLLLPDGVERVRITDFGLARAADDASLTRSGVIAGTPQYMSPEQARGDAIDYRSDLFSLGSVLYAMCTGHPPFRAETSFGILRRITDTEQRPIRDINPEIPMWLCRIVNRLLAKDPADRPAAAADVEQLLADCLNHVQTPGCPLPAELQETHRWSARLIGGGITAAVLVLGLWWMVAPESELDPQRHVQTPPDIQRRTPAEESQRAKELPRQNSPVTDSDSTASEANDSGELSTVWNDELDLQLHTLMSEVDLLDTAVEFSPGTVVSEEPPPESETFHTWNGSPQSAGQPTATQPSAP